MTYQASPNRKSLREIASVVGCEICTTSLPTYLAFVKHIKIVHNKSAKQHFDERYLVHGHDDVCLCGCGAQTRWSNKGFYVQYVKGHNSSNPLSCLKRGLSLKKAYAEGRKVCAFSIMDKDKRSQVDRNRAETMRGQYRRGELVLPMLRLTANERSEAGRRAFMTKVKNGNAVSKGWRRIKKGVHTSVKAFPSTIGYDSGLELVYMKNMDADPNVLSYERCSFVIKYNDPIDNHSRLYNPDFTVYMSDGSTKIVEAKGELNEEVLAKGLAACEWCSANSYRYSVYWQVPREVGNTAAGRSRKEVSLV